MLYIKSKKVRWAKSLGLLFVLLTPSIVLAASETGSIAARQAADQKAALAKKAAEREAKKAAEAQASESKPLNEVKDAAEVSKGK